MNEQSLLRLAVLGAIEVHRAPGSGLPETVCERTPACGLASHGIHVDCQVEVEVDYKGIVVSPALRVDMVLGGKLLIEVTSVEYVMAVHDAQTLTSLKLMRLKPGLRMNFNVPRMVDGMRRFINGTV